MPSSPELVQVHMVFAIMYYQYGLRNSEQTDHLNDISNRHYHFALSKMFDLMFSPDVGSVQAMILVAIHARSFPKPGCGTLISNLAYQRAVDLNLHVAPKVPPGGKNLDTEMKKRTWWVLMSIFIYVTGRCGRPMPMTVHDFDVPLPDPVNDELLTKEGIREPQTEEEKRPLEWAVALESFKIVPILLETYTNIYGARQDVQRYPEIIQALDQELKRWEDEIPPQLRLGQSGLESEPHKLISACYVKIFGLELRLWMRHNAVNPLPDRKMIAQNTHICEQTSLELLGLTKQLMDLRALDSTWTAMTTYVLGMFSLLVAQWERRHTTTLDELATLRKNIDSWMAIIDSATQLIGKPCIALLLSLLLFLFSSSFLCSCGRQR